MLKAPAGLVLAGDEGCGEPSLEFPLGRAVAFRLAVKCGPKLLGWHHAAADIACPRYRVTCREGKRDGVRDLPGMVEQIVDGDMVRDIVLGDRLVLIHPGDERLVP